MKRNRMNNVVKAEVEFKSSKWMLAVPVGPEVEETQSCSDFGRRFPRQLQRSKRGTEVRY